MSNRSQNGAPNARPTTNTSRHCSLNCSLDATITSLEARLQPTGHLTKMKRTDAIVDVLRTAAKGLGPTEILNELKADGRDDKLRDVTAPLDYLYNKKRVDRVSRGSYVSL